MRKIFKWLAAGVAVSVLLTGCGADVTSFVKSKYQFESVDGADQQQSIYRAANQTVPVTAKQIADQNHPDQESATNAQDMFLVYSNTVIHVQQDPQKKQDSLVEVDTKQYVAQHYDPSFLQGFLAGAIISNIFGSNWKNYSHGNYRGYDYKSRYPSGGGSYGGSYGGSSGGYHYPSGGYSTPPKTTPPKSGGGFITPPRSGGGTGKVIRRK